MIKINYVVKNGRPVALTVRGHANSNDYGLDLVCAGVSAVVTGGFNALSEKGIKLIKLEEGNAEVKLDESNLLESNIAVLEVVLIQLGTIEETYPKYVKITKEVQ